MTRRGAAQAFFALLVLAGLGALVGAVGWGIAAATLDCPETTP